MDEETKKQYRTITLNRYQILYLIKLASADQKESHEMDMPVSQDAQKALEILVENS